jgi:hypothetical protein
MISPELHAQIRRLFFAEHWRLNTIAAQFDVHHDTVRRVIACWMRRSVQPSRPSGRTSRLLSPLKMLAMAARGTTPSRAASTS